MGYINWRIHGSHELPEAQLLPAFSDTSKGLLLTCIQDTAEGVANVIALDL
jgi:hypothetical protein